MIFTEMHSNCFSVFLIDYAGYFVCLLAVSPHYFKMHSCVVKLVHLLCRYLRLLRLLTYLDYESMLMEDPA